MPQLKHIKQQNRLFEKLAHRDKEYHVSEIAFKIILFHSVTNSQNRSPELHSHTTLELSLIEQGQIEYFTENINVIIKKGEVFFMPPGQRHNWRILKRPFIITGFQLDISTETDRNEFLQYFGKQAKNKKYRLNDFYAFSEIIDKIRKQFKTQPIYFMDSIDCLIQQLLIEFVRKVPLHFEEVLHTPNNRFQNALRTRIIKNFIRDNLSTPLTLADIADYLNLSIRQLNRIFTEQQGISLGAYILHSKIEAAKHELENSKKLIKEIAINLGFDDINYFCRVFRKKTGLSPSKYRKFAIRKTTQ